MRRMDCGVTGRRERAFVALRQRVLGCPTTPRRGHQPIAVALPTRRSSLVMTPGALLTIPALLVPGRIRAPPVRSIDLPSTLANEFDPNRVAARLRRVIGVTSTGVAGRRSGAGGEPAARVAVPPPSAGSADRLKTRCACPWRATGAADVLSARPGPTAIAGRSTGERGAPDSQPARACFAFRGLSDASSVDASVEACEALVGQVEDGDPFTAGIVSGGRRRVRVAQGRSRLWSPAARLRLVDDPR
jgi:hypothetical protein